MPVLAGPFCCRGGIFVGTNARGCAWFNTGWPLRPIGYPVKYRPQLSPEAGAVSFRNDGRKPPMAEESEILWHIEQIAKNRTVLEQLEGGNTAGGEVFPETRSEIERVKAQLAQSELIVASYEKKQ
jgi:hypothetical protein